jgi:4-alpha-glucanotransferase
MKTLSAANANPDRIEKAATLWGIQPEFWDIWGQKHHTSPATAMAILSAMGVDVSSAESLERALDGRTRSEWIPPLPPTLVLTEDDVLRIPISLPSSASVKSAMVRIVSEDGDVQEKAAPIQFPESPALATFDGVIYTRCLLVLNPLPFGYYDLTCTIGDVESSTRLIVAPQRAWCPKDLRTAGIAISLPGVRSARNWGCGDFRDLRDLVDWAADELQAGFIGLNPLHAIHNRRPFNTSPYLPNCVFYRNPIYLDVESIEDFSRSKRAQRLWQDAATQAAFAKLRASEFVEYEEVWAWKLRFLKLVFVEFLKECRAETPRANQFRRFIETEGDLLERYAVYCALDEWIHKRNPDIWTWPDWPEEYRDPSSVETQAFRRKHWRAVMFYQYLQWLVNEELHEVQTYARSRMRIGLYHDLALATDRCGSDLWAHRDFFVAGCRVGSPPDDFAPQGQDWAFPPPNSQRHFEDGYRLFAESIRNNLRQGGALRIDHVMRFFRLYWIPDGADATDGAYVLDRVRDLLHVLALESVRNEVVVVGEDLGTVEPEIRDLLHEFGLLSYRLFYFEREGDNFIPNHLYPSQALISSTTHDLPTLAGFWTHQDIETRRATGIIPDDRTYKEQVEARKRDKQKMLDVLFALNLLPPDFPRSASDLPDLLGEMHNAIVGFLAMAPSQMLLINQEDLTKEVHQQNVPGTTWQYPNWGRKIGYSLEQLKSHAPVRDFAAMFRHWIIKSGRT